MRTLKKNLLHALESDDLSAVAALAKGNRRILSELIRLAYDKETLAGWRAIKAIGLVAKELLKTDPEFLRETTRKLLWSLSDESGAIGWSAPEILGEIVSAHPERFRDIIPLIAEVYDIEEKVFRPGVVYALAQIAEVSPDIVVPYKDLAIKALSDDSPLVRVYGIELVAKLKSRLSSEDVDFVNKMLQKLSSDRAEVWVYRKSDFINIQVRESLFQLINDDGGKQPVG